MSRTRQQAIHYLGAHRTGYWWWAEDGAVLVWRDGTTIAFRQEIVEILKRLAPHGLPPFGALALLLAGCRGKFPPQPQETPALNDALDLMRMRLLVELPAELRTGLVARSVLAEAVFENVRPVPHQAALEIVRELESPLTFEELREPLAGQRPTHAREIMLVAEGLKRRSAASLALRLRTGLDALPPATEESLPPAQRARRLIEELSRDRECGPTARAARDLMAAARLPRRLAEKEELPLGGVSDITNRGPLDRLLLSELAHDDLTLSVRVALNEALYLRREPPMREPPGTLALLLDSGVRLWGTPRVLATAVALALAAQDRHGSQLLTWRASHGRLQAIDLLSRHGLTDHLAALETEAHPGLSLAPFARALPPGDQNQAVIITHRDALDDPDFRRKLSEQSAAVGFVATVTREGQFELHAMPLSRRPPVCQAELDLNAILAPKHDPAARKVDIDPDLPVIFGLRPFPFLLPLAGKLDQWSRNREGILYGVMHDRRLVSFRDSESGGHVLAHDLPAGRTVWIEEVDPVLHAVKVSSGQRPPRLISFTLPDGPLQVTDLAQAPVFVAVHRTGDVILAMSPFHVHAISLESGGVVGQRASPHHHVFGQFYRGSKHYYAATWDGNSIQFEEISLPSGVDFKNVIGIFDRAGMEGPWILTNDGDLRSTAGGDAISVGIMKGFPRLNYVFNASRDGHRFHLQLLEQKGGLAFDLNKSSAPTEKVELVAAALDPTPALPSWNLFRVIEAVGICSDGLALLGRKGQWRRLALQDGVLRIKNENTVVQVMQHRATFTPASRQPTHGCTLQRAEWPNGSSALLDSRGLIHFRGPPGDATPEVSIVVSDREVAGWTSDGHRCGPKFFFEEPIESDPQAVLDRILWCFQGLG